MAITALKLLAINTVVNGAHIAIVEFGCDLVGNKVRISNHMWANGF
ncbi:hypothetical protein D046_8330 [Vibrio parahaemolyticus V-223/04]|nr:hypothetical protein D046_8330 [Vibrio parahaemolyticus V-223/04]